MFIPFVSSSTARAILEQEMMADEHRGEMLAEYGSDAFYSGFSSADATFLACERLADMEDEFRRSEEGELYFARLEAARFAQSAITRDMRVVSMADRLASPWETSGHTVVPEYHPYDVTGEPVAPYGFTNPNYDDIPF